MESGLLRQRRNLISISSLIIVYDFADIKIKQVGLMGTTIDVGNPGAISLIVWVVWFYFFLRYYQYWSAEKDAKVLNDLYQLVQERASDYCNVKYGFSNRRAWSGAVSLRRKRIFKWAYEKSEYDDANDVIFVESSFSIPIGLVMWWSMYELFNYCFHKKHMSDHVLPFALALTAVLVKIYSVLY